MRLPPTHARGENRPPLSGSRCSGARSRSQALMVVAVALGRCTPVQLITGLVGASATRCVARFLIARQPRQRRRLDRRRGRGRVRARRADRRLPASARRTATPLIAAQLAGWLSGFVWNLWLPALVGDRAAAAVPRRPAAVPALALGRLGGRRRDAAGHGRRRARAGRDGDRAAGREPVRDRRRRRAADRRSTGRLHRDRGRRARRRRGADRARCAARAASSASSSSGSPTSRA